MQHIKAAQGETCNLRKSFNVQLNETVCTRPGQLAWPYLWPISASAVSL